MKYSINELKHQIAPNLMQVYEVFQDFFGENNVDLQGLDNIIRPNLSSEKKTVEDKTGYWELDNSVINHLKHRVSMSHYHILVYWNRVKVMNEYDRYVYIDDLYARIPIYISGRIVDKFQLTRATYPIEQWLSNYCHSHLPGLPRTNEFLDPCLGSGPIQNTIQSLENSNDLLLWQLFCQELATYVTVESIRGVPYRRLENIGTGASLANHYYKYWYKDWHYVNDNLFHRLEEFVSYYLEQGHFSFNYVDGFYQMGISFFDYIIDVSNCLITWINQAHIPEKEGSRLMENLFITVKAGDGKFFTNCYNTTHNLNVEGRPVCTFKGKQITLHLYSGKNQNLNNIQIFKPDYAMLLVEHILQTLNYHTLYGTNKIYQKSSQTGETILYL